MQLRNYQQQAVEAVYEHLRTRDDNPVVVIPTAGGKTPVIATICRDAVSRWNGRVLILAHVKELLEQAVEKLNAIAPDLMLGIYSAGLNCRDTLAPVIVAGIQSVYKRAGELGFYDLILIDEVHTVPIEGDGIYRSFLQDMKEINPNVRLIGLTATPYRMKSGMICGEDNLLNHICYEIGVKELINRGYLCPLISKAGKRMVDTSKLHIRGGEFIASETEDLMDEDNLVIAACDEIVSYTASRHSCLIFASGIKHAEHIAKVLRQDYDLEVECVFGDTPSLFRAQHLEDFKSGRLKYLINVGVLTTGFDAPCIDCVVLLRPTNSPGLYYQSVGRGFRLHPGKQNCLVLDYGGNIMRHGPVDMIRVKEPGKSGGEAPAKTCPECYSVIYAGYMTCPDCGYVFSPSEQHKITSRAESAGILSGQTSYTDYEVSGVEYSVHHKRGAPDDAPKTIRIEYNIGFMQSISEWVCPEHSGWVRAKFESWWRNRGKVPPPCTAAEAVKLASDGALAVPRKIIVKSVAGEKYDQVVDYELGPVPDYTYEPGWNDSGPYDGTDDFDDDQIPF